MLKSYKELEVWKKGVELAVKVYKITEEFPKEEMYGLVSQMRRAAISVPSNIAEGYKRKNLGEYLHFLSIADASLAELETQVVITKQTYPKINMCPTDDLILEVEKMLFVMIRKLKEKES